MLRTQISLNDAERAMLDAASARSGRSMSDLVREAVRARFGDAAPDDADRAAVARAFGSWSGERPSGEQAVDALRSGRRLDDPR